MEIVLCGDALETLQGMEPESVNTCITSPPYYNLRDYGTPGQIGMEETPEKYIESLVLVFREVRRVLREDGTLWINIGDSYATRSGPQPPRNTRNQCGHTAKRLPEGYKKKDLINIDTLTVAALLHDVCKIHLYEKQDGGGYRHNEQFPIGHGEKSVILILRHMQLTDEEITAISWHMGAFDSRAGAGRSLSSAWEKCPLALHLHLADMEATWFDEGRGPQG